MSVDSGAPYGPVAPKRTYDNLPVGVDWHDYLANLWQPGVYVSQGTTIRLVRKASTGFEYVCTTAGLTGKAQPRFPSVAAETVPDGSVVWTAQAISSASLRTQISTHAVDADTGITVGADSVSDLVHVVFVDGGQDGSDYQIRFQIVATNGEEKEGVVILPVRD